MNKLEDLENYARENYIPIARKELVAFLKEMIIENSMQKILEIGTAIAYTAISLASLGNVLIDTIEYDAKRFIMSKQNVLDFSYQEKINCIFGDALTLNITDFYDLIFIDASKKKNQLFFEKYAKNLKKNGKIIIDNMNLTEFMKNAKPKKALLYKEKIAEFQQFLNGLSDYNVQYLDIGDGIAIVSRI